MEQEEARKLATSMLKVKATELSGAVERSKMVYRYIRRITVKKIKNHFLRRILKFVDVLLCWVVKKLEEKAGALSDEQQRIQEALNDSAAGRLDSTIKLLEESFQPLGGFGTKIDSGVFQESFYDAWFIDLINTLRGGDNDKDIGKGWL